MFAKVCEENPFLVRLTEQSQSIAPALSAMRLEKCLSVKGVDRPFF
jgi:hypothetical protein